MNGPIPPRWLDRFEWTPHGYEKTTNTDNPLRRPCTWCGAAPGHPCTRLTRRGTRVTIHGHHDARTTPVDQEPAETPPSSHQEPRT